MSILTYVVIGFMVWLASYCIVDRICTAVEKAAMFKAYGNFVAQGMNVNPEELKSMAKK